MAEEKIDELEQKKKELEEQLEMIQNELDHSIGDVRSDMSRSLAPRNIIRKYPLPSLGAAVLAGFLVGHNGRRSGDGESSAGLSSALASELKRLATRKAIRFATDYVEDLLDERDSKDHSTNGSSE